MTSSSVAGERGSYKRRLEDVIDKEATDQLEIFKKQADRKLKLENAIKRRKTEARRKYRKERKEQKDKEMEASAVYKDLYKRMMKAATDIEDAREACHALDEAFPEFAKEIEEEENDASNNNGQRSATESPLF
ncbi:Oidioi.mRNA.OKI2018_I69.XSR.g14660.t1.cds [Oikopleura dioica]|uniref:Oidioi.mRNA.OKI2018_I69.XSR.g14660.t1.cds n=1 Tax=Oikopleura dioica TaxID=34765 RepID=A0ABN7SEE9_OIKDI|nr:Oidioi.mRNA.OKI2018_I69.XSR.g14660.t1.cds [Oikopleura dioica]